MVPLPECALTVQTTWGAGSHIWKAHAAGFDCICLPSVSLHMVTGARVAQEAASDVVFGVPVVLMVLLVERLARIGADDDESAGRGNVTGGGRRRMKVSWRGY